MPDIGPKKDTVSSDGLFLREFTPAGRPRGVFLLLHGMESHSGWFAHTAVRLVTDGWAVLAYDRFGWGKSPGRRGHLASYRDFVERAVRIAAAARHRFGAVHLAGMSWGGMAALYLGLRRGWLFDSIACLSPGIVSRLDIPLSGSLRIARDFIGASDQGMVEPAFNPAHFTRDPEWRTFIADDPDRVRAVSTSFCLETLKMRRFIKETAGRRLLPPTLCLLAGSDEIVDNQATAAVCRRAGAIVESLPDAAHTLIFERPEQTADILSRHAAGAETSRAAFGRRFWVIGAGAVGGTVASLLSFAGVQTAALVKPSRLDSLARDGFALRSGGAVRVARDIAWAATPRDLPPDPELVVVAVKSFDTPALLADLREAIPPGAVIASIQNGVGNEDLIASAFPRHTIVAASICASLELGAGNGAVWADDRGGMAGALHRGDRELAQAVWRGVVGRSGMECAWIDGANAALRLKWSKLMLNIGFNALNSATGKSSRELLEDEIFGTLVIAALREGFSVMDCLHLHPVDLPGFPVSKLRLLLKTPFGIARRIMGWQARRSPEVAFSMRQDIVKNRQRTEINELNGAIVRVGRSLGLNVAANAKLVEMVENINK